MDGTESVKEFYSDTFFARVWQNRDPFEAVRQLEGELFRHIKSRRTIRFELEKKGFFLKYHTGCGWKEIFKNLTQFKLPVLSARNEFRAITLLGKNGIKTMTAAAYGCRGWNPANLESFLITNELCNMVSLEDLTKSWKENPPDVKWKRQIIRQLAQAVRGMHQLGVNHRDCYICHFLLNQSQDISASDGGLYIIDLHRAEIRKKVPFRLLVKDLGGLAFSALDLPLTNRDWICFLSVYFGKEFWQQERLLASCRKYALKLYQKEFDRNPTLVRGWQQ